MIRFIPTPYLILGISVAIAVSHGAAVWGGWKLRDNSAKAEKVKELTIINNELVRLQHEVRAVEAEHAAKLVSVSTTLQERLQSVRDEKDKFIAGVRSGAIRLRIPTQTSANANSTTEVVSPTCGCDETARGELPSEVAEFLWSEAGRADEVTHQLTAAQATIKEYLEVCGAK